MLYTVIYVILSDLTDWDWFVTRELHFFLVYEYYNLYFWANPFVDIRSSRMYYFANVIMHG